MTVLYIWFEEGNEFQKRAKDLIDKNKDEDAEIAWERAHHCWDEAEIYLKSYIKELVKQEK